LELREEIRLRRSLQQSLSVKAQEAERLRAELQSQKKYTVMIESQWPNLTWNEAVAKANHFYDSLGIHYLYIADETGKRVRTWKQNEQGIKVTV
jgi:hypothetical protein